MMTNLFSIFDPSTSIYTSFNWISFLLWLVVLPFMFWTVSSRMNISVNNLTNYITSEFKMVMSKSADVLLIILSLFIIIMMNNVQGLLSYTFTATSHMSVTLMMALPLWLAIMMYGWYFNTYNLLTHLIPNGTPTMLMPFMVIIETISNIIRPITLAIRLAANMIAGHLLISLLTSATELTPLLALPMLGLSQIALEILEIAVALIQAYVFSVLMTLYISEAIN